MRNLTAVAILTIVWIILVETFDPIFLVAGIVVSFICMHYSRKYLPLKKIDDVNFYKIILYPFYMIGQIYAGGIYVIKVILAGERADIVTIDTAIKNETLRVILADSITLTPGSILIDLTDDKITLVWLRKKNDPEPELVTNKGDILKGHLEARLAKAQKE